MGPDLATTIGLVIGVVVVAFLALVVVGVVLLSRRARRDAVSAPPGRTDAGVALVRADDAVRDGADELAFAVAQFGDARTADFTAVLAKAKADLGQAFRLQQQLDDGTPDSDQQRSDWTRQIRTLADRARASVALQSVAFQQLRSAEADAPAALAALRTALTALATRRAASATTLAGLRSSYAAEAVAGVAGNLDGADSALADATRQADAAAASLAASATPAVTDAIRAAQDAAQRATQLLDAIDRRRDELAEAETRIAALEAEQRTALTAAKALRDAPPDPDSGAAVGAAIAAMEAEIRTVGTTGPRDPVADLDGLVEVSDKLDIAVAAARNQQRRLDGAREALQGALLSARSQIAAVTDYIGAQRGSVGADARTRLAEAQRQLMLAENDADPVDALDTARRSQTLSRDADALARYDTM